MSWIREGKGGITIAVKVVPRSSRNEIGSVEGDELKVWVMAPPVDAAANEAVVGMIAKKLGCSKGAVEIIRGGMSRHKTLRISGKKLEEIVNGLLE
ncbi:MAG: DUF167 domain-containing protein [Verrucomicrobiota bacterium]|nr:DUF167 domain-containing protein [Verrucomicrobiota bacterium]